MKKSFLSILAVGFMLVSCMAPAEKQFLTESDDIELAKSAVTAYVAQDWDTFSGLYSDTAKIWRNIWPKDQNAGFTVQQYIADLKEPLETLSSFTFEEQQYENIINDDGHHWVYFWGRWVGSSTLTNKEYVIPVHSAIQIEGNKIVWQGDIFNNAEITVDMMALQMEAEEGEDHDDEDDDAM